MQCFWTLNTQTLWELWACLLLALTPLKGLPRQCAIRCTLRDGISLASFVMLILLKCSSLAQYLMFNCSQIAYSASGTRYLHDNLDDVYFIFYCSTPGCTVITLGSAWLALHDKCLFIIRESILVWHLLHPDLVQQMPLVPLLFTYFTPSRCIAFSFCVIWCYCVMVANWNSVLHTWYLIDDFRYKH